MRPRSIWIAAAAVVLLAGTLARSPQTGDGAEIVAAALRGGVLHPPGFPLQAWLDRAWVRLSFPTPSLALSLLGLVAHAGAAGLIAATLGLLGVGGCGRVMAAAAFALYPPTWGLAVQPEVFSLAHLLMAAMVYAAVRLGTAPAGSSALPGLAGLGLLGSLGAAQHPVTLAALPALVAGAAPSLRRATRPGISALLLAATFVLPATLLYLSLPLLRTDSLWPDWGVLHTPSGVIGHMLRKDYGGFTLSADTGPGVVWALRVWLEEVARGWHVALVLLAIGLVELVRRRELRPALLPVVGMAAAGLGLLAVSRLPEQSYTPAVLEHLQGAVTISGALLIGIGTQAVRSFRATVAWRNSVVGVVALTTGAWLVVGWPMADASRDRTLELYARGIALELSDDMVYVTEGDVEAFLGVPTGHHLRYPVSQPLSSLPWYASDTAPRLEPRAFDAGGSLDDWGSFLGRCFSRGLAVASSSESIVQTPAGVPELRGLLYVAHPGGTTDLTPATIAGAIRLTPLAEQLPVVPPRGHAFSRFYVRRFARAYAGAGETLRRSGATELALQADSVADALDLGYPRATRSRLLSAFVRGCHQRGF